MEEFIEVISGIPATFKFDRQRNVWTVTWSCITYPKEETTVFDVEKMTLGNIRNLVREDIERQIARIHYIKDMEFPFL